MVDSADSIFVERFELGRAGLRVAVKDTFDIAGFATRAGSRTREDAMPAEQTAPGVQVFLDAGCRLVGKTNMHELAYGVTGINAWIGTPLNPAWPDRVPGGSSSGSAAAVAAGLADIALGTDTGGSIRIPAACCGVFGLKPTFGLVDRTGVLPAETSLDCVGPFGATAGLLTYAMLKLAPALELPRTVAGTTLGLIAVEATPVVGATVTEAALASGFRTTELALPGLRQAFDAGLTIIAYETWRAFGYAASDPRLGADVAARLAKAALVSDAQRRDAEAERARFTATVDAALDQANVLVLPTMPDFPLTLAAARDAAAAVQSTMFVRPFNLSGHPALSIPLRAANGLPVGLQLVGRKGDDVRLCAVASDLEQRLPNIVHPGPKRGPNRMSSD